MARLQHLSTLKQLGLVTETDKERDVRLEGMSRLLKQRVL